MEELVVVLSHEAFAAVEDLELHVLQCQPDFDRIHRLGLVDGGRQHAHLVHCTRVLDRHLVLVAKHRFRRLRSCVILVGRALADFEHPVVETGLLDRGRPARAAGVVGEPVDLQAGIGGGLQEQREILAPVAGDHGIGARRFDLGDVGREISHLQQRVEFVTDNGYVRPLGLEHRHRRPSHRMTKRIVLVDQIDLLDVGLALHVVGEGLHLDVGIGVPAEMRECAFVVGQNRIDRRVIEIEHFLAWIALVVFGNPIRQGGGDRRAIALRDDPSAGIDRLLHLNQAFLRIGLVIEGQDFEFFAGSPALGVQLVGHELERFQPHLADRGAWAR